MWRIVVHKAPLLFFAFVCVYSSAMAQEKAKDGINDSREQGYSVKAISPIFSQLVMLSLPKGFKTVFENSNGNQYIREAVLEGETVDQWSQMITVTGAKGLVANQNPNAQLFAGQIASVFKRACPDTFSAKALGAIKISGQDAFIAVASCGTVRSGAAAHSETALLIAIKGSADYYTVQWAERETASSQPMVPDEGKWIDRFGKLNPIKICAVVPGEAAPYPSCIDQK
jgi:hypothetical protein